MSCIYVDRQQTIHIADEKEVPKFCDKGSKLFRDKLDTLKVSFPSGKCYLHFGPEGTQVFETRLELQQQLSQESGGAWVEQRGKQQKYFLEKGWVFSQIQQVGEQEFMEAQHSPSFARQATGIALGILGLAPGVIETARRLPEMSYETAALSLLAFNQKCPSLALLGSYAAAQSTSPGSFTDEFQINTYFLGLQEKPQVAPLLDGGFVVVWQSFNQDGSFLGIFGQRYDGTRTAVGSEFRVNTFTTNNQVLPVVKTLSDGGFVVVWESLGQDGSDFGVYGQRYESTGWAAGAEFQVNTYNISVQESPQIGPFPNGGFVIIWQSVLQDGDNYGIYGQRYDSDGVKEGAEFRVNDVIVNSQENPSVATSENSFLVTWQDFTQDGSDYGIFAKLYTITGTVLRSEFQVNNLTQDAQINPRVIYNAGNYMILWQGVGPAGSQDNIYGRLFDENSGMPSTDEFIVNTYTLNNQQYARVAALNSGDYIVVWQSQNQDGSGEGIYGQRLSDGGTKIGPEFLINTNSANDQIVPSVIALQGGEFVVIWTSIDDDQEGIFGQRYDSSGNPEGAEFQVNDYTINRQINPVMQPLRNGGYIIAWQSLSQDGDNYGIIGRCFDCSSAMTSLQRSSSTSNPTSSSTPTPNPPIASGSPQFSSLSSLEPFSGTIPHSLSTITSTIKGTNVASDTFPTSLTPLFSPSHSTRSPSQAFSSSFLHTPSITINYEVENPIYIDNIEIGIFTFTGGSGILVGSNDNTLTIELNGGYYPEDGETIVLFTIPEDEVDGWSGPIIVVSERTTCVDGKIYNAEGELVEQDDGTANFQIIFKTETCGIIKGSQLTPLLSLYSQI